MHVVFLWKPSVLSVTAMKQVLNWPLCKITTRVRGRAYYAGLHFQKTKPQGKLVSVVRGAVFDVAADINPASPTYGQYVGVELSEDNHRQLWVPPGYAHGFVVLTDAVDFVYKCTDYYDSTDEGGVAWNCPTLNIAWPLTDVQLSEKDQRYPGLKDLHG
jgi:dTDP-4-dehydrorhamnose 3,5-epimerase